MIRCRPLLGTLVEIAVRDGLPDAEVARAIGLAFEAVERVEGLMSFHRPTSELSRLNAGAAGALLTLDPWTHEVLRLAVDLHAATGGLFDPGVGAVLVGWKMLPNHPAAPRAAGRHESSIADVEILDANRVRIRRPVCLDLGGIAKGFAVDRAVDVLRERGVREADVNAGGDLRILGAARPVHLRDPRAPGTLVHVGDLADGALATSASYFSGRMHDGEWRSELVDPRLRAAVPSCRSFSVLASTCAVADGLSKGLAIAGELSAACLARYDARSIVL